MKEVEILVSIKDEKETVLKKLKRFNFIGARKILDVYFYDPQNSELNLSKDGRLNRCLRLRRKDNKFYLTYKIDRFDNNIWLYSDEHEVEVSDFETCREILENLGLKILLKIENKKHTFLTDKYEIVFEEVKNLGLFLEVERLKVDDNENLIDVKKEIRDFIKSLNIKIGRELNVGKAELILKSDDKLNLIK